MGDVARGTISGVLLGLGLGLAVSGLLVELAAVDASTARRLYIIGFVIMILTAVPFVGRRRSSPGENKRGQAPLI